MLASLAERLRPQLEFCIFFLLFCLTAAQAVSDKPVCMLLLKTRSAGNLVCKVPSEQRMEKRHLEPLTQHNNLVSLLWVITWVVQHYLSGDAFSPGMAWLPAGVECRTPETWAHPLRLCALFFGMPSVKKLPAKEIKWKQISGGLFTHLTPETLIGCGTGVLNEGTKNREHSQHPGLHLKKRARAKHNASLFFPAAARHFCTTCGSAETSLGGRLQKTRSCLVCCPTPNSLSSNQSHQLHMSPITGGLLYTGTQLLATGTN